MRSAVFACFTLIWRLGLRLILLIRMKLAINVKSTPAPGLLMRSGFVCGKKIWVPLGEGKINWGKYNRDNIRSQELESDDLTLFDFWYTNIVFP